MRDRIVDHVCRDAPLEQAAKAQLLIEKPGNIALQLVEVGFAPGKVLEACCAVSGLPPCPLGWLRDPKPPATNIDADLCRQLGCAPVATQGGKLCIAYGDPEMGAQHDALGLPPHLPFLALASQLEKAMRLLPEDDLFEESTKAMVTDDFAMPPATNVTQADPVNDQEEALREAAAALADDPSMVVSYDDDDAVIVEADDVQDEDGTKPVDVPPALADKSDLDDATLALNTADGPALPKFNLTAGPVASPKDDDIGFDDPTRAVDALTSSSKDGSTLGEIPTTKAPPPPPKPETSKPRPRPPSSLEGKPPAAKASALLGEATPPKGKATPSTSTEGRIPLAAAPTKVAARPAPPAPPAKAKPPSKPSSKPVIMDDDTAAVPEPSDVPVAPLLAAGAPGEDVDPFEATRKRPAARGDDVIPVPGATLKSNTAAPLTAPTPQPGDVQAPWAQFAQPTPSKSQPRSPSAPPERPAADRTPAPREQDTSGMEPRSSAPSRRGGLQVTRFEPKPGAEGSLPQKRPTESLDPDMPAPEPSRPVARPEVSKPTRPSPGIRDFPAVPQRSGGGALLRDRWPLFAAGAGVLILVVALLWGSSSSSPAPPGPPTPDATDGALDVNGRQAALVERGRAEKDDRQAVALLSQAIALNANAPSARDAFLERARRSLALGDVGPAEQDLQLLKRRADGEAIANDVDALLGELAKRKAAK